MNTRLRHTAEFALIAAALIISALNLPYICEMQEMDEFYQALASTHYYQSSPLAPLSYYMGHVFTSVFGNTLLNLRVLMLLCSVASITLGLWYFYRRTRDGVMSSLLFFALLIASQIWGMNIYNWDTGCYPFVMCGMIASLAYLDRPTLRRAMLLAAAWALMLASRVTLGITLPFLIAEVVWCHRGDRRKWMRQLACGAAVALTVLAALTLLIYGSFGALADAWAPENIITGHLEGHRRHLDRITQTGMIVILNGYVAVTAAVFTLLSARVKRGRIWLAAVAAVVMYATIYGIQKIYGTEIRFNIFLPITLAACFYPLYRKWQRSERAGFMPRELLMLMFVLCTWPGSDGYLERPMSLSAMPVVLTLCYPQLRRYMHTLGAYLCLAVVLGLMNHLPAYRTQSDFSFGEKYRRVANVYTNQEVRETVERIDGILNALPDSLGPAWVIGEGDYAIQYLTDRHDATPRFHRFHWQNAWHDADFVKNSLPHYNVVLESRAYRRSPVDSAALDSMIREQGFELAGRVAPTNIYLRRGRSASGVR